MWHHCVKWWIYYSGGETTVLLWYYYFMWHHCVKWWNYSIGGETTVSLWRHYCMWHHSISGEIIVVEVKTLSFCDVTTACTACDVTLHNIFYICFVFEWQVPILIQSSVHATFICQMLFHLKCLVSKISERTIKVIDHFRWHLPCGFDKFTMYWVTYCDIICDIKHSMVQIFTLSL